MTQIFKIYADMEKYKHKELTEKIRENPDNMRYLRAKKH